MFVVSFCACRSHWFQWDTCLFKSRNTAASYGQNFWFFFPNCSYFSASLHGASCHMLCFLKDYAVFAFSIKAITHTHVFLFLHTILLTHMRRYVWVVGTDLLQIFKPLLLTVLLTRILLQCLPDEAGACCTSIIFDRRVSPALTKRNKYRMLMAGNVHRAENNIFDKMLSIMCLSQTLTACDNYCCPSQTWVMELSFLLQFLINVTAIKELLIEESFK